MEDGGGVGAASPGAPAGLSASQRRAELRRRKLLMNSEERINRIMGFHRPAAGKGERCGAVWCGGSRPGPALPCPSAAVFLGKGRKSLSGVPALPGVSQSGGGAAVPSGIFPADS